MFDILYRRSIHRRYDGGHNQLPEMGTDLSRKLAIAQTRYMDK